jgi:hypothetical protein
MMLIFRVEFNEFARLFIDPRPFRRFHLQEKNTKYLPYNFKHSGLRILNIRQLV